MYSFHECWSRISDPVNCLIQGQKTCFWEGFVRVPHESSLGFQLGAETLVRRTRKIPLPRHSRSTHSRTNASDQFWGTSAVCTGASSITTSGKALVPQGLKFCSLISKRTIIYRNNMMSKYLTWLWEYSDTCLHKNL